MMDENTVKRYPKDDFILICNPDKCIHASKFVKSLPRVYHPKDNKDE